MTTSAVRALVMSPWTWMTPSIGAIGCKSMATIRGRSPSFDSAEDFAGRYNWRLKTYKCSALIKFKTCFSLTFPLGTEDQPNKELQRLILQHPCSLNSISQCLSSSVYHI
jgi:hypothetical protein